MTLMRLNGTEFLDWQELWCFRCEHDHAMSHGTEDGDGCPLILGWVLQEDQPEWIERGDNALSWLPAHVSCERFQACQQCPPDSPDAERRGGETRIEFHDRLRAETLAIPRAEPGSPDPQQEGPD